MASIDETLDSDIRILQTRSSQYHLPTTTDQATKSHTSKKTSGRLNVIKCKEHEDNNYSTWAAVHSNCKLCTRFSNLEKLN